MDIYVYQEYVYYVKEKKKNVREHFVDDIHVQLSVDYFNDQSYAQSLQKFSLNLFKV